MKQVGTACDGLDAEYHQLRSERADPEVAAWRTLEAMLGFDPDDAPEGLVGGLEALTERYGAEPLQEAALAHQGAHANAVLDKCLEAAECSNVVVQTPFAVNELQIARSSLRPPWLLAANAADRLRDWLGVPSGPQRNTRLSEIVGINVDHLKSNRRSSFNIPYALRLRDDAFGPLSAVKSEREKFRRAFAQAFLCPFADLQAYINTEEPTEEDIHAAARHFHVSERLIQTTLYNNHVIDQASFEQMVGAA